MRLPATRPDVQAFEVVQIEALLSAIERGALDAMSDADAVAMAKLIPADAKLQRLIDKEVVSTCRWHVAAQAAHDWRQHLRRARDAGHLPLVDMLTLLPLTGVAPAPQGASAGPDWAARLTELRALGGAATGARGRWTFSGLPKLAAALKARNEADCDEKTLRKHLREHLDSAAAGRAIGGALG